MKKLILIFSAFALIVVLSSFSFSNHEMVEVEEFQGENLSMLMMETGTFTESTSSKYDSLKNEWNNTNRTDLPIKGLGSQQKALDRMETIVFTN